MTPSAESQPLGTSSVEVRMLDEVGVFFNGVSRPLKGQVRQLIAALVACGPSAVSVDILADNIWPEDRLPSTWATGIRNIVTNARDFLGDGALIRNEQEAYRLDLPVEAIDFWSVVTANRLPEESDRLSAFAAVEVFPGLEPFPQIEQASQRYFSHRRHLLRSHVTLGHDVPALVLDGMSASARNRLSDPSELEAVLTALLSADQQAEAEALHEFVAVKISEGGLTHRLPDLAELVDKARPSGASPKVRVPVDKTDPPTLGDRLPSALEVVLDQAVTTIRLGKKQTVVLCGQQDYGHEEMVRLVTAELSQDRRTVVSVVAPYDHSGPLQPFLTAFPDLAGADSARGQLGSDRASAEVRHDSEQTLDGELLIRVQGLIGRMQEDLVQGKAPVVLVLNQVERFDSASIRLLKMLIEATPVTDLQFVLGVTEPGTESGSADGGVVELWQQLHRSFTTETISLAPLERSDVTEVLSSVLPTIPSLQIEGITDRAMRFTQGRYSLLQLFFSTIDGGGNITNRPTGQMSERVQRAVASIVTALPVPARRVGTMLSVLQEPATLQQLGAVLKLDDQTLHDGLDLLVDRGLVFKEVDSSDGSRYSCRSHSIADGFQTAAPQQELRRLHKSSGDIVSSIHRKANHQQQAGDLVDVAVTVGSLVDSAREHLRFGAVLEGLSQLRMAERISEGPLSHEHQILLAGALARAGYYEDSEVMRAALSSELVGLGQWDLALEAALAGLPEAELYGEELNRMVLLEQIPTELLSRAAAFRQLEYLGRLALLQWRSTATLDRTAAQVRRSLDHTTDLAETVPERLAGVITTWLTGSGDAGKSVHEDLEELEDLQNLSTSADSSASARLYQMLALSSYASHSRAAGIDYNQRARTTANACNQPLRMWHADLFSAMVYFTDGDWEAASNISNTAAVFAKTYGIVEGFRAKGVHELFRRWVVGRLTELAPMIRHADDSLLRSIPGKAAHIAVMHQADELEGLEDSSLALAEALLRFPSPAISPAAALLVPFAVDGGSRELVGLLQKLFDQFSNRSLVLMAGLADFGPAERYQALLSPSEATMRRSIDCADHSAGLLWQVISRLDFYDLSGDPTVLTEAKNLASGTSIVQVVDARTAE